LADTLTCKLKAVKLVLQWQQIEGGKPNRRALNAPCELTGSAFLTRLPNETAGKSRRGGSSGRLLRLRIYRN